MRKNYLKEKRKFFIILQIQFGTLQDILILRDYFQPISHFILVLHKTENLNAFILFLFIFHFILQCFFEKWEIIQTLL